MGKKQKIISIELLTLYEKLKQIRILKKNHKLDACQVQQDDASYQLVKKLLKSSHQLLKNYIKNPNAITPSVYLDHLDKLDDHFYEFDTFQKGERERYYLSVKVFNEMKSEEIKILNQINEQKNKDLNINTPEILHEDSEDFNISNLFVEISNDEKFEIQHDELEIHHAESHSFSNEFNQSLQNFEINTSGNEEFDNFLLIFDSICTVLQK